ncbi:DNA methyltransferase [Mycoplasma sp. CSL7503-lung]|uniref:DNA methyltransferase n=1 Tax=Mycoplasma sp. CSL7503-lung TaxID=536372 RepID=UPI0021D01565|nr:site-specific DNA-methyltransferase [Mycoplasma sp. CSL7503-lung]MCU4706995.1 site-specific DNA-methyltransferase [Mycoplasma sp. CSL7503-lung]
MDPPYNTESARTDGNNSANDKENVSASKFIYRDKFSRNGWLNMMNERLKLAKKLLKDDGVIFVSIDDNEQAYLKVLMDEVFGEENFVANLIWKKHNSQNDAVYVENNHEYILSFSKNKLNTKLIKKVIKNENNNSFSLLLGDVPGGRLNNRYKMGYSVYWNEITGDLIPLHDYDLEASKSSNNFDIYVDNKDLLQKGYVIIRPPKPNEYILCWKWSIDKFLKEKNKIIVKRKKDGNLTLHYKDEREYKIIGNKSVIDDISSSLGSRLINDIYIKFPNSKPIELIKHLLKMINSDARILDFFAGSGTTGHAVMELNREDGGNRTFTLVTNNENNIGYDVTYERLYRVNHGIGTNNETFKWTEKNDPYKQNLNVFDLEYSNISVDQNQTKTEHLVDTLRESLTKFEVKDISDDELLNNLTNLYSLDKEKVDKPDGTN